MRLPFVDNVDNVDVDLKSVADEASTWRDTLYRY
jgi:hypothetical protein